MRMSIIKAAAAPVFEIPGLEVCGLAAPSRGSAESCVWRLTIPPGTPGTPHAVDREEIFIALSGEARVELDGEDARLAAGDTLVVPAGRPFSLSNPGAEPFVAMAVLPVGGRAVMPDGACFSPPWTL
jgi:mannose-6-phosphate isomerase-like protein (cupin superfamily)